MPWLSPLSHFGETLPFPTIQAHSHCLRLDLHPQNEGARSLSPSTPRSPHYGTARYRIIPTVLLASSTILTLLMQCPQAQPCPVCSDHGAISAIHFLSAKGLILESSCTRRG